MKALNSVTTIKNASGSFGQIIDDLRDQTGIRVLSLDCFDTLFWRRLSEPLDVFAENGANFPAENRIRCEGAARGKKQVQFNSTEPTIEEICAEYEPDAQRAKALARTEIDTEKRVGFVFSLAVEALRLAKSRGLRTIVVSDTYYTSSQLREIIESVCPEAGQLIDHIYCSCENGAAKVNGLWRTVLNREKAKASEIYHIGDNEAADRIAPAAFGVIARHLKQNTEAVQAVLSARNVPAKILFPQIGSEFGVPSLFHDWYAQHAHTALDPYAQLGHTFLGPVMACFGNWLHDQVRSLKEEGRSVKVAFLYRDGYMLEHAYKAVQPEAAGTPVRISRFSSWAASFADKQSVIKYLGAFGSGSVSHKTALEQLLVDDATQQSILARVRKDADPKRRFFQEVMQPGVLGQILKNSKAFRQRLMTYVRKETGVQKGDTLVLVDVGYDGTTQNTLQSHMQRELGIDVVGRYVLSTPVPGWQNNRRGMIDASKIDAKAVYAMTRHIAAFELLCSSHDATVLAYTDGGQAVFGKAAAIPEQTLAAIKQVQQHALLFISHWCQTDSGRQLHGDALWRSAAIDLARFIYFPSRDEIDLLSSLQFEINLGVDERVSIVDVEAGLQTMRERGIGMLTNNVTMSMRTNFPAELRHSGMEMAISTMTSQRMDLRYPYSQENFRTRAVEVLYIIGAGQQQVTLQAKATFDGYYSLLIPNMGGETVVLLGKAYSLVQFDKVSEIPVDLLYSPKEAANTHVLEPGREYMVDCGTSVDVGVIQFANEGFIYLPRRARKDTVINLVFRPLCARHADTPVQAEVVREEQALDKGVVASDSSN